MEMFRFISPIGYKSKISTIVDSELMPSITVYQRERRIRSDIPE